MRNQYYGTVNLMLLQFIRTMNQKQFHLKKAPWNAMRNSVTEFKFISVDAHILFC